MPLSPLIGAWALLTGIQPGQPLAPSANWSVTVNNCLTWNGTPYVPIGLRIQGTVEAVRRAKDLGFGDVLIDLPLEGASWAAVVEEMERLSLRYVVAVDAPAPKAAAVAVDPAAFRVPYITKETAIDMPLPHASRALVVMATQRDGSVQWSKTVDLSQGRLRMTVDPESELEHVLLIYPITDAGPWVDGHERLDDRRDQILRLMKSAGFGKGLRAILNPIGRMERLSAAQSNHVPVGAAFRLELEAYLRKKYGTFDTAIRAWAVSAPDFTDLGTLARLVPLWTAARGVPLLWDPISGQTYDSDQRRSAAWIDIQTVVAGGFTQRLDRLVDSVQAVCWVPVILDWRGWGAPENRDETGISGVAARLSGRTPIARIAELSQPASSVLRAKSPRWLVVTDLSLQPDSEGDLTNLVIDATSMGARGIFIRSEREDLARAFLREATASFEAESAAKWKPLPLFYPESSMNPAVPMRTVGGRWWLPAPTPGRRVDFGSLYAGYRYDENGRQTTVLWSTAGERRVKLRLADPKSAEVTSPSGQDLKIRLTRKHVELTIGNAPVSVSVADDMPVPEDAVAETAASFVAVFDALGPDSPMRADEEYQFRDAMNSLERQPGPAFVVLREQLRRVSLMISFSVLVEAESSPKSTFSEVLAEPGTSGNRVLSLRTPLPSPVGGYFAEYKVPVRADGEHEVWMAARLPEAASTRVSVLIGDRKLGADSAPVSHYSTGYAWHRLGTVDLMRGTSEMLLIVEGPSGADAQIDAIYFSKGPFRPDGLNFPFPIKLGEGPRR